MICATRPMTDQSNLDRFSTTTSSAAGFGRRSASGTRLESEHTVGTKRRRSIRRTSSVTCRSAPPRSRLLISTIRPTGEDSAPDAARAAAGRRSSNAIATTPVLEHEQDPDLAAEVAHTGAVGSQDSLDLSPVDPPGAATGGRQEPVVRVLLQAAAEPVADRDAESHLPAREHFAGHVRAQDSLEQVLAGSVAELQRRGGRVDLLDEPVVEKRHTRLERMAHRHAIHLDQDVVRQIVLLVDVLQ